MTTAEKIKAGVDLLESFANDYQFDMRNPGYLGFINVGVDLLATESDKGAWRYVVANPDLFLPVLDRLGLFVEAGCKLDLEETVFITKN
jgi:hypothetical protein